MGQEAEKLKHKMRFKKTIDFPKKLTGPQKAAILFQTLDGDTVKSLLKHLDRADVDMISRYLSQTSSLTNDDVLSTLREFQYQSKNIFSSGDAQEKVNFFLDAYSEVSGNTSVSSTSQGDLSNLKSLVKIPPEEIAEIFKNDHDQIFALVLSQLPVKFTKDILTYVDTDKKNDLLQRIACIKEVNPEILKTIDQSLEPTIKRYLDKDSNSGGTQVVANILGMLPEKEADEFLAKIKDTQESMYEGIRQYYVGFSDIMALENDMLQKVLAAVENDVLAKAICKLSQDIKDKCFSVITKRAVTLVESELNALDKVLPIVITDAQQVIVKAAKKLASENKIVLGKQ